MILCKVLKHSAFICFETVTVMNVVMQKCCLNYNNVVQWSTFLVFFFYKTHAFPCLWSLKIWWFSTGRHELTCWVYVSVLVAQNLKSKISHKAQSNYKCLTPRNVKYFLHKLFRQFELEMKTHHLVGFSTDQSWKRGAVFCCAYKCCRCKQTL